VLWMLSVREEEIKIKACIMAAGAGERMFFFTRYQNKSLLRLGGIPLLTLIVKKIIKAGIVEDNIIIVCLEKDYNDYKYELREFSVTCHPFSNDLGTGGHYHNSMPIEWDEPVLVHYGDVFTDLNYKDFIAEWDKKKPECLIAVTSNIHHDYSAVDTDMNGVVQYFEEKPEVELPSWTGIAIIDNQKMLKRIGYRNTDVMLDFAYDIFPEMVRDHTLYAYEYNGEWFDLGNARSYEKLHKRFQEEDILKII
jgi:mannose-1-phosphate guanylyltransferase